MKGNGSQKKPKPKKTKQKKPEQQKGSLDKFVTPVGSSQGTPLQRASSQSLTQAASPSSSTTSVLPSQSPVATQTVVAKQVSNPFSTGGGGEKFEQKVQAYFVSLFLIDGVFPPINKAGSFKIALQTKMHDLETDDMAIYFKDQEQRECKILAQIKFRATFKVGDKPTKEAFRQAWLDFNNPEKFNRSTDRIVIITGTLAQEHIDHLKPIFEWARRSESEKDFMLHFIKNATKKKEQLEIIRTIIKNQTTKEITDQELWEFLKVLNVLDYDLDSPNGKDVNTILSLLRLNLINPNDAHNVWSRICQEVGEYNSRAGAITKDNFSKEIVKYFCKINTVKNIWEVAPCFTEQNFVGNKAKLQEIQARLTDATSGKVMVPILGFGGLGKTYLALKTAYTLRQNYTCIVWFDASSVENIEGQFVAFAKKEGIFLDDTCNKIEQIKLWFDQIPKILLVFDNAESYAILKPYLPSKGHILITSINSIGWDHGVHVEPMNQEDAVALLKQEMGATTAMDGKELIALVELLGRLPLAVAQAGAYINTTGCSVADYIKDYHQEQKRMLENGALQDKRDEHKPVYITFELCINKIAQETPLAVELLNYCAFLEPHKILIDLFKHMPIDKVIPTLHRYSLVKRNGRYLDTHCVIQDVIRAKITHDGQNIGWLLRVIELLNASFSYYRDDSEKLAVVVLLAPHLRRAIDYAMKNPDKRRYATQLGRLLHKLGIFYLDYQHDSKEAIACLKKAETFLQGDPLLQKNNRFLFKAYSQNKDEDSAEKYRKITNVETLAVEDKVDFFCDLGNYYLHGRKVKDFDKARDNFQQALKCAGDDKEKMAMIYHYLGITSRFEGDKKQNVAEDGRQKKYNPKWILGREQEAAEKFKEALNYYQQALKIKQECYGEHSGYPEIARTLYQMGVIYTKLKEFNPGKAHIKQALRIWSVFYKDELKSEIIDALCYLSDNIPLDLEELKETEERLSQILGKLTKLSGTTKKSEDLVQKVKKSLSKLSILKKSRIDKFFISPSDTSSRQCSQQSEAVTQDSELITKRQTKKRLREESDSEGSSSKRSASEKADVVMVDDETDGSQDEMAMDASQQGSLIQTESSQLSDSDQMEVLPKASAEARQLGWNCFDMAVGIINGKDGRKRIVEYALQHSGDEQFRRLLAPEIRHAAALTAVYMNSKLESEKQISRRIIELFEIANALKNPLEQAQVETYAAELSAKEEEELLELARNALPLSMHSEELRRLVNTYTDAHEQMKAAVAACNVAIGKTEGNYLSLFALDEYFSHQGNKIAHKEAYEAFNTARVAIYVPAEQALDLYCNSQAIYEQYVRDYYGTNQWFAFQPNISEPKAATSMVDVVARMLNAVIVIYQGEGSASREIYRTADVGSSRVIEVQYNGHNHFWQRSQVPALLVEVPRAVIFSAAGTPPASSRLLEESLAVETRKESTKQRVTPATI